MAALLGDRRKPSETPNGLNTLKMCAVVPAHLPPQASLQTLSSPVLISPSAVFPSRPRDGRACLAIFMGRFSLCQHQECQMSLCPAGHTPGQGPRIRSPETQVRFLFLGKGCVVFHLQAAIFQMDFSSVYNTWRSLKQMRSFSDFISFPIFLLL